MSRSARLGLTVAVLGSLALVLAACGGKLNSPDMGTGCSLVVYIPTQSGKPLGTVTASYRGTTQTLRRNENTILMGCGEHARLSAASAIATRPFRSWKVGLDVYHSRNLSLRIGGPTYVHVGFKQPPVAATPTPTPTPTATPSPSPSATPSPSTVALDQWVSYDLATKSVTWKVVAGYQNVNHGLSFDGYSSGAMKVSVPRGWSVTVNFSNAGKINHSAAIVSATGTTPVFPGASVPNPTVGIPPGGTSSFTFEASAYGNYRLSCLVPGHEDAGMWVSFAVTTSNLPHVKT